MDVANILKYDIIFENIILQNETGKFVSPKDSINEVRNILSNINLSEEQVNKICYCIEYHEEYNWNGNNVEDLNTVTAKKIAKERTNFMKIFVAEFLDEWNGLK